jgi:3-hydroxyisobutyrate dehydrogenase-like beta-hydroxyacid dehydrogenase
MPNRGNPDTTRCGVIGVGTLGHGFVKSLARAGFPVSAYDLDPDRSELALAAGAAVLASPGAVAAASEIVLLALPDTPDILEALAGEAGLEAGLRRGSVVLVMSTVAPATPVALAARLEPLGVEVLDAPVSGGPERAHAGTLSLMVGGSADAVARCDAVLRALGEFVHVGPIGHGEITKLANNLIGAVTAVAIAEGLTLAAKAGADLEQVRRAIAGASGDSWLLREWIPQTVLRDDYAPRFALSLMCKDMRLIASEAERLGVPIALCEHAAEVFEAAAAQGLGGNDFSVVAREQARAAGTSLAVDRLSA